MVLRSSAISVGKVTFLDPEECTAFESTNTDEEDASFGVAVVLRGEITNADIVDGVTGGMRQRIRKKKKKRCTGQCKQFQISTAPINDGLRSATSFRVSSIKPTKRRRESAVANS